MSKALRICFGSKTKVVDREALDKVKTPQATDSYMPIGHGEFVSMAIKNISEKGMQVLNSVHALNREGQRYFGLMEVSHPDISNEEMSLVIGLRNSFDKSVPASLAAGNAVFVCDNLQISGEIVIGRKHTKNLFDDIRERINSALSVVEAHWLDHFDRTGSYKAHGLSETETNHLIVEAFRNGAISKVGIADVIEQWYTPNHFEFRDRNLWALHNAFTEIWKGRADLLPSRTDALHNMFDKIVGFSPKRVAEALGKIDPTHMKSAGKGARSRLTGTLS